MEIVSLISERLRIICSSSLIQIRTTNLFHVCVLLHNHDAVSRYLRYICPTDVLNSLSPGVQSWASSTKMASKEASKGLLSCQSFK